MVSTDFIQRACIFGLLNNSKYISCVNTRNLKISTNVVTGRDVEQCDRNDAITQSENEALESHLLDRVGNDNAYPHNLNIDIIKSNFPKLCQ